MSDFIIYDVDSAPEASRGTLADAQKQYGMVPNLMGIMAESPALVRTYAEVGKAFESSSLSPLEQQIVILTASFLNECSYCMAAHSMIAKMVGLPAIEVEALREGRPLDDPRLETLRAFTRAVVRDRGSVSRPQVEEFLRAGFTKAQLLDVVLGVAFKTLSNYTNHIVDTPLDEAFAAEAWRAPVSEADLSPLPVES